MPARPTIFVAESCAAFAEGLLASELFGHEAGAFTGAVGRKRGLFELAHGGTLFLDEVGDMPAAVQANLLHVLQEGQLRCVGGEVIVIVDARLVAATHRDLATLVSEGRFPTPARRASRWPRSPNAQADCIEVTVEQLNRWGRSRPAFV